MRRVRLSFVITLCLLLVPAWANAQDASTPAEICEAIGTAADPENRTFAAAEQVIEPGVDYRAIFCTGAGPIYIDLLEEYAPITVNSFVFLAQQGYYNNTMFHRVIEDFMAQGGDPEGTGTGGPGYQFEDEFVGFLHFDRPGWLAMANAGPGTNGSQFFITTVPTPHLNYLHTIFGEVLEGQENVEAIELRDPSTATEPGTALNTIVIITDPAEVTTTYEAPAPATQDDVTAAFAGIETMLPPELLAADEETSGIFTTEEVAATAPEGLSETYAAYLESHNHEYRAANHILNTACDLQNVAFTSVGYTLDAYATADDAAAALTDPVLDELTLAEGLESAEDETGLTYYTTTGTACDIDVRTARMYWQRGHFVSTVEITIPAGIEAPLGQVLVGFVGQQIYEQILSGILRPEMR